MKLIFPDFSLECLEKIEKNGFEAWFVGGCVRDALLGRNFYDIDIATNAKPSDIMKIFDKTLPTGIKHGTVTVIIDKNSIEVTTYRSETGYLDARHPDSVEFMSDITEDLSRRDFTINALAFHPKRGLVDLFFGIEDLNNKTIRCVNNPHTRFSEDALRILRAYRFASQLGFSIEEETKNAAISLLDNLKLLSGERILSELIKLVCGKNPDKIRTLISNGSLEFCGIKSKCSNLSKLSRITNTSDIRLPIFLNLCGFDSNLLKSILKIDRKSLNLTTSLYNIINHKKPKTKSEIKMLLYKYDKSVFELYLEYLSITDGNFNILKELYLEIIKNNEPYNISHLNICGDDILSLGINGKEIGLQLEHLLKIVIDNPSFNNKEILISMIKN